MLQSGLLAGGRLSTKWRAQNLFERLTLRRDTCIALPQRYIKQGDFRQLLESPRAYPQHDGRE
jgi:hypothetical protein